MYNRQLCVADGSYQLAYEHVRQLECAGHLRTSTEASPFMLVSGKHQVLDGEKKHFDSKSEGQVSHVNRVCSVAEKEFKKRTVNIPSVGSATVLNSLRITESTYGSEALENGKRPSSNFCGEVVNKRARQEDQGGNLGHVAGNSSVSVTSERKCSSEEPGWKRAAADLDACEKSRKEVDNRLDQLAQFSFFQGLEDYHQRTGFDQLEDFHSPLSEHSHHRLVSIGPNHQADLPQWTLRDSKNLCNPSDFYANSAPINETASPADLDIDDANSDKWLGTCVIPMPNLDLIAKDAQIYCSKIDCDCADEGSIRCVRKHVMEAREKLSGALGQEKFREMGFSDMGEVVAQRWTEVEEILFHEVLLSNPVSLGRNFWSVLPRAFPSRSFKDLVSYYFNIFMLRKRADQNRFDPLNVDSDNDEWQGSSDGEFEMSEEEGAEEDGSVVESPADGNSLSLNNDFFEELEIHDEVDDEEEYEECLGGTEDEGFLCGSDECKGYESKPPIDRNSSDCSDDQDVQDDSCTSYEDHVSDSWHGHIDSFSMRGNHVGDHQNLHMEYTNDGIINLADYEFIDGHHYSKPWEINYIGATEKDIDFFPTCNVLEEVFGKGPWDKDVRDGSAFN